MQYNLSFIKLIFFLSFDLVLTILKSKIMIGVGIDSVRFENFKKPI